MGETRETRGACGAAGSLGMSCVQADNSRIPQNRRPPQAQLAALSRLRRQRLVERASRANESRTFLAGLYATLPYGRRIARDGSASLFNRSYVPTWRKHPGRPPEAVSGSRGEPWVDWVEQHWFFCDRNNPFRRTAESRAMRRDLEEVLREFRRGEVDGPVARRLIRANAKEAADHARIDAEFVRALGGDRFAPVVRAVDGSARR
jgi:hypothetical protein